MTLDARYVARLRRSKELCLISLSDSPIAMDATFQWLESGQQIPFTLKVRIGDINEPVDNLWTTRRMLRSKPVDNSKMIDRCLHRSVRSIAISERLRACSSRVHYTLSPALCLLLGVTLIQMQPAQASETDQYKLYAHSRIVDFKQYQCFISIINKENRSWDVDARNGSHFGLGQMRSQHYRNLDGYRQIDMILKYIKVRYKTVCKAWSFHQKRNYF